MPTLEMPHIDIESGRRSSADNGGATSEEEEDGSAIFSDADPSDCSAEIESGANKVNFGKVERECRICHLSLFSSSPDCSGVAIELGCSCKDDLAAAHKHCADTWFKIKGNKTCEICNSIAQNVIGPNDIESALHAGEASAVASTASELSNAGARRCLNGHRFLNFVLACMVFAFVISWLFHFNIPS